MKKQTVVAKFGGTSVADAAQFRKIRDIVLNSPDNLERRFIVVSAPGRRFPGDQKVTDLLLACYEKASAGKSFSADLEQIRMRYREITDGLKIEFPLEEEFNILEQSLLNEPDRDFTASRGEYLTAKLMAHYLGFTFVHLRARRIRYHRKPRCMRDPG